MKKIFIVLSAVIFFFNIVKAQARFVPLGDLDGGKFESYALGVSGDGKVVVGSSENDTIPEAVRWIYNAGTKNFTLSPLGLIYQQLEGEARSSSFDGSIVAGTIKTSWGQRSYRWGAGGGYNFFIPQAEQGNFANFVYGISSDGSTVVGEMMGDSGRLMPYRYKNGSLDILPIPSWLHKGLARSVSGDGSVIVGSASIGDAAEDKLILYWNSSGWHEVVRANVAANGNAISRDGKKAIGNYTTWSTPYSMFWNLEDASVGGLPNILQVPWALSGEGSVIAGWSPYNGTFGGTQAVIWDAANGARIIQEILVNSYKINLAGWKLTMATGVSDDGSVIVGVGTNPNGKNEAWWVYLPYVSLSGPYSVIAQEKDTLKWTYAGIDVNNFNIYLSLDSGKTRTPVVKNIQANLKRYTWSVPDTIAQFCKLYIVAANDTSVKSETKFFDIKGYRMIRYAKNYGSAVQFFDPAVHGWKFSNEAVNLWPPSWWFQFNYQQHLDPYTQSPYPDEAPFDTINASTFIDWPLFVKTLKEENCYWLIGGLNTNIYKGKAIKFWESITGNWGGSCSGLASTTILGFYDASYMKESYPELPDLNDPENSNRYILSAFNPTNEIRSVINSIQIKQLCNPIRDQRIEYSRTTNPNKMVNELKNALSNPYSGKKLSIFSNDGGHALVPYRLWHDPDNPRFYRIYVNDSNIPGSSAPFILIDTVNNTYTYNWLTNSSGNAWTGWDIFLEGQLGNYLQDPQIPKSASGADNLFMASSEKFDFYFPGNSNVIIKDSYGNKLGNSDGTLFSEIPNGSAIIPEMNSASPIGYTLPKSSYSIEASEPEASRVVLNVFTDSIIYSYTRFNADSTQKDQMAFGYDGLKIKNSDSYNKLVTLETIIPRPNQYSLERQIKISSINLQPQDSLSFYTEDLSDIYLSNYGSHPINYDIKLKSYFYTWDNKFDSENFQHYSITINPNSAHIIEPEWSELKTAVTKINYDNGIDGEWDGTYDIINQYTGINDNPINAVPENYDLMQNYPNPFNSSTVIKYSLPKEGIVTIKIFNAVGEEITTLVNELKETGNYHVNWSAGGIPSGVYFCQMKAGDFTSIKKMVLMK